MREKAHPRSLPDDELLHRLSELVGQSRRVEADLVAHIAEVDTRRLYAREGTPSMFSYCTDRLRLSEPETGLRLHVARACRKHPVLLDMLRDGRLHLSGIAALAPHLTPANRGAVLKRAVHASKRQIEKVVAELKPRPAAPTLVRKVPAPQGQTGPAGGGAGQQTVPALSAAGGEHRPDDARRVSLMECASSAGVRERQRRLHNAPTARPTRPASRIEPVAPARFRVHFDASAELCEKLERLQALKRSSKPNVDLGAIIDEAVTRELERVEARRFGKTKKPRKNLAETNTAPKSRNIPVPVKRAVWKRDGGQCTYVDSRGRRCTELHNLEYHHVTPFGRGGGHSPEGIVLLCRAHHALVSEQDWGKEKVAQFHRSPDRVSELMAAYGSRHTHTSACGPEPPTSPP